MGDDTGLNLQGNDLDQAVKMTVKLTNQTLVNNK
jgi:hypothetical protein